MMDVNYVMVQYLLGIDVKSAKLEILSAILKGGNSECADIKKINKKVFVDSKLINKVFHHPSEELDGKRIIDYTIDKLKNGNIENIKRRIISNKKCLKFGRICGSFDALNYILEKDKIKEINAMLTKQSELFIKSGGSFK